MLPGSSSFFSGFLPSSRLYIRLSLSTFYLPSLHPSSCLSYLFPSLQHFPPLSFLLFIYILLSSPLLISGSFISFPFLAPSLFHSLFSLYLSYPALFPSNFSSSIFLLTLFASFNLFTFSFFLPFVHWRGPRQFCNIFLHFTLWFLCTIISFVATVLIPHNYLIPPRSLALHAISASFLFVRWFSFLYNFLFLHLCFTCLISCTSHFSLSPCSVIHASPSPISLFFSPHHPPLAWLEISNYKHLYCNILLLYYL